MTNRDKKDSIRGRMADTGEPFNVARRKVEAATAQPAPDGEPRWELIEVEVATTDHKPGPHYRRHTETFWGRWVIEPNPEKTPQRFPVIRRALTTASRRPAGAASPSTWRCPPLIISRPSLTTTTRWMMPRCQKTSKTRRPRRLVSGRSSTATSDHADPRV